jgi:voltage-gated potassium channel Kch
MRERFTGQRLAELKLRGVVLVIIGVATTAAAAAALLELLVDPGIGSTGDALWWAVATVTTTGYGDVVPTNAAGRIVGVVLMMVGISLIPIITSLVITVFIAQRQRETTDADRHHRNEIIRRLEGIESRLDTISGKSG